MVDKRTTDLFRFVTLRTPENISDDRKTLGFIEHPNPAQSHFLVLVDDAETLASNRANVRGAINTFTPLKNVQAVKDLSEELWEFAIWLEANKNKLVRDDLDALIPTILPAASDFITLWDNVFYDVLEPENPYLREACLKMIIANNFIENYVSYSPNTDPNLADAELELITRLADGKVMIHMAFTIAQDPQSTTGNGIGSIFTEHQATLHNAKLHSLKIPVLKAIRDDLREHEQTYNYDFDTALDSALTTYKSTVDSDVSAYLTANPDLESTVISVTKSAFSEKDGASGKFQLTEDFTASEKANVENLLPADVTSKFSFSFDEPLSDTYSEGKIATDTANFIASKSLKKATVGKAIEEVERDLRHAKQMYAQAHTKKYKDVLVNGVMVRPHNSGHLEYALSIHEESVSGAQKSSPDKEVYLSFRTGYNHAYITSMDFEILYGLNFTMDSYQIISNDDQMILVKIIMEEDVTMPMYAQFTLDLSFQLNDGSSYMSSNSHYWNGSIITGLIEKSNVMAPVTHYGVNTLGVADFRKVEQELCCYIPGEVSHIENILAREYKEKATRQLSRTEITTEISSEREAEEQSDTTSTMRSEMSTEISEVIQRDRRNSVGLNSSTGGKAILGDFSLDVRTDFSFGQSTSQSDSIAKNYAEDVTRRALERIVQRTATRRTSTILREFEENNRHGFDNREGELNVTGVYRWIDKVYKNRIVNYGKRLMYEFMIPEPAKFYKEAIIIKAEEENITATSVPSSVGPGIAIKPNHPKVHGINSAADLNRENYSNIGAIYNAQIAAPLDEYANLADTYAESIGNGDQPKSFTYSNLLIDDNYTCVSVRGKVNFHFRANALYPAYIKVNIGSANWQRVNLFGYGDFAKDIPLSSISATGTLSVSVNTKKITAFNLSVEAKCRLKSSIYEQWQQNAYTKIMEAYEEQLQAFNDAEADAAIASAEPELQDTIMNINAKFTTEIMQTELKRLAIEMLARPFGLDQGKSFYQEGSCEVPEIQLNEHLDIYSTYVKFFEDAFDWSLMAQKFYPYYWADKCDWKSLFQSQATHDHWFKAFLQSGMGRLVVPVKEGFEDAVTFFMETGQVWNGSSIVVDTDDELYVSIADEMTTLAGKLPDTEWETVVPSTLTIVQQNSVKLTEDGLPCCEVDPNATIVSDTNILTWKEVPSA